MSLQVSIGEAMTAQCSPPPSEPANRAFLRLSAIGRMARSTTLESISMRSSAMKCVSRPNATAHIGWPPRVSNQTKLGAQPGFELVGDRPALLLADGATLV